jgi:type IV fimbrial biogenesis protein FimT
MKKSSAKGFTLLELMVAITVAAVAIGLAVPNMAEFAKNRRLTASVNDLLATLYSARSEAIKQQRPVNMCFTTTPAATTPACDGDGTQGWIAWVDADSDETVDAAEQILTRHEALHDTLAVVTKPASTSRVVSYGGNGFSRNGVANALRGVVFCDARKNTVIAGDTSAARGLLVDMTGRAAVTKSQTTIKNDPTLLNGAVAGTCVG